jgi:hypothetical protein
MSISEIPQKKNANQRERRHVAQYYVNSSYSDFVSLLLNLQCPCWKEQIKKKWFDVEKPR